VCREEYGRLYNQARKGSDGHGRAPGRSKNAGRPMPLLAFPDKEEKQPEIRRAEGVGALPRARFAIFVRPRDLRTLQGCIAPRRQDVRFDQEFFPRCLTAKRAMARSLIFRKAASVHSGDLGRFPCCASDHGNAR